MPKTMLPTLHTTALALALWTLPAIARADGAGYAIELDGTHGYLGCDLPAVIRSCNQITLSAWIFRAGPRGEILSPEPRGQAAVGLGFHLGLSAGKIFMAKGGGSGTYVVVIGTTAVPISEWHHVAATYDGATMRVYLDGILDGSLDDISPVLWDDLPPIFPPTQSNWPSPAQLFIGADKHNQLGDGPTVPDFEFYEGSLDEAQIWSRALTQEEIAFYRRSSLAGDEPGLVGYWKFDEGTGITTADATLHDGDLTLYPGATWKPSTAPVNVIGVGPASAVWKPRLSAFPNPTAAGATIALESRAKELARVTIFDQGGRRVVTLWSGETTAGGRQLLRWDGRDHQGHPVASGVYLVRLESPSARLSARLLVLR